MITEPGQNIGGVGGSMISEPLKNIRGLRDVIRAPQKYRGGGGGGLRDVIRAPPTIIGGGGADDI